MATWLKQSTAVDIKLGPFVDDADGFTTMTGLTISQADVRLAKNNGAWAQKNDANSATHEENGWYEVPLNTTDTDTLGILIVAVNESGALPVWREFSVVTANVWDTYFSTDALDVNVISMAAGTVTASAIATGAIDADAIADNAIDAGAIAADAITAAKIADGAIDAATFAAGAINAAAIATGAIDADALAADAVTEIRSLVSGTSDSGSTTTMVDSARSEADTDYWKGCFILFTSGNILGQCRLITGFTPASDTITFAPATTQAVSTQTYEILPSGRVDLQLWLGSVANALVSGRVDASVGAMAAGTVTAAAIATDAIDADALAAGAITSDVFATDSITASAIAANAIGASELATDAVAEIADAVWDEDATGHQTQGTFGQVIGDSGADTDSIWSLANTNLDTTVSSRLAPTTAGRTLDVTATGAAGIDWGNLENPSTANNLSATNIDVDQVVASVTGNVGGNVTGSVGSVAAGGITASSIATGAIDADALAADAITEIRSTVSGTADSGSTTTIVDAARTEADADYWKGSFILFTSGSIVGQCRLITAFDESTDTITFAPATTQAVSTNTYEILPMARVDLQLWLGSVVNSLVSGRVDASVGAMAAGTVTAAAIATDAIDADALAAGAITSDVFAADSITASAIAANAIGASELATDAVAEIADAVWDEDATGHQTQGSFGQVVGDSGADSDSIWSLANTNLDATVSSRATPAQVNTEVLDVMTVDTFAEPSGVVAGTATLKDMLNWLKALARNRVTMTSTTQTLRNDANSSDIATSTQSDDGTTYVRGEWS